MLNIFEVTEEEVAEIKIWYKVRIIGDQIIIAFWISYKGAYYFWRRKARSVNKLKNPKRYFIRHGVYPSYSSSAPYTPSRSSSFLVTSEELEKGFKGWIRL